jgi:hypothetical protein
MQVKAKSKAVAKSRKSDKSAKRAPAWAHTVKERVLEALDGQNAAMPPPKVPPAYKMLAAAYADLSMAALQFTIVMGRLEDPASEAILARHNRELFLTHKPVRLFRKRTTVKPH